MNLGRILNLLFTSFLGQMMNVLTQLLVPPFFLRYYGAGVEVYGEWIALSASVNYLGTLNYGVQTYSNNQMTILYNGGDVEGAKTVQASAFRLLLVCMAALVVGGLALFAVPVAALLKLRHVGAWDASMTLYVLVLQMGAQMIFSLLTNSYMVVGKLHRGNYWSVAQRFCFVVLTSICIAQRALFSEIAGVQLLSIVVFSFLALIDLRRAAPVLVPSLRYGSWADVKKILMPSGHFGLIAIGGFLTWQAPVILIQRVLGPLAVGQFSLVRVVFQMSRQVLSTASYTIGQDITLLVGKRDWKQLLRFYDLSERVVLSLTPIVSLGSMLLCPFLFTIWLHKRSLYDPLLCLSMAVISAVLGIKEHKTQFQSSSNQHEELSKLILVGYSVMLTVACVVMPWWGLNGFLVPWLVWEIMQTFYVMRMNRRLFPEDLDVPKRPVIKLCGLMAVASAAITPLAYLESAWPLWMVVVIAIVTTLLIALIAYFIFDLDEMRSSLLDRMRRRRAAAV